MSLFALGTVPTVTLCASAASQFDHTGPHTVFRLLPCSSAHCADCICTSAAIRGYHCDTRWQPCPTPLSPLPFVYFLLYRFLSGDLTGVLSPSSPIINYRTLPDIPGLPLSVARRYFRFDCSYSLQELALPSLFSPGNTGSTASSVTFDRMYLKVRYATHMRSVHWQCSETFGVHPYRPSCACASLSLTTFAAAVLDWPDRSANLRYPSMSLAGDQCTSGGRGRIKHLLRNQHESERAAVSEGSWGG